MEKQLQNIIQCFNKAELKICLNSGTLLGLLRDGKVPPTDIDYDFAAWNTDKDKIRDNYPHFKELGYEVREYTWNHLLSMIYLIPAGSNLKKPVDIKIFHRIDNFAVCPWIKLHENPYAGGSFSYHLFEFRRQLLNRYKIYATKETLPIEFTNPLWRGVCREYCWWIPRDYFEKLSEKEINEIKTYIPTNWEYFLEFRYGNWQEPEEDWDTLNDDGGVRKKPAEELLE